MPRLPTDYSKIVIYKFVCDDPTIVSTYVGSTIDFRSRKWSHKSKCNNENDKGYNTKLYQTIRANGGWDCWKMLEVEKYPCNDKREAEAREQYWIELQEDKLNSNRAIRKEETIYESNRQYKIDNADKIREQRRLYNTSNRERLNETKRLYRQKKAEATLLETLEGI